MSRDYVGADETTNFQKAVAGETELRGKVMTQYNSAAGIKKFRYLYNAHTASRAAGLACYYVWSNTSYPGLAVTQATTGNLAQLAGIHAESVTSGAWGWVQVEGHYAAANTRLYGSATNKSQTACSYLGPGINEVDALTTCASAECEPDSGMDAANNIGYCITVAGQTSHSDTSSTTTTQAVHIFGVVR